MVINVYRSLRRHGMLPIVTLSAARHPLTTDSLVVGKIAGDIDGSGFNIFSCLCAGVGAYRIRRYTQNLTGIQETEDASMMAVGLLGCCAVNQDAHELMHRGIIPSLTGGPAPNAQQMQATQQMQMQHPSVPDPAYHA